MKRNRSETFRVEINGINTQPDSMALSSSYRLPIAMNGSPRCCQRYPVQIALDGKIVSSSERKEA